jgi:hypothetical protein
MSEKNPPIFMDGTNSPAEDARRFMQAVMGPGIARLGDLAVTEKSGTPNLSVDVAAGGVFVLGTSATYQGTYFVENRGTVNKPLATAHATNARKDIIVARVRENVYDSSGSTAWDIHVVTGTPAGSPVAPAIPANSYLLATVDVPATDTVITNSQITSARTLARPWNSAWGVVGSSSKTSSQAGITTTVDISDMSAVFTAVAGRRYRTTVAIGAVAQVSAPGYITLAVADSSNNAKGSSVKLAATAAEDHLYLMTLESDIPAGSQTRKARVSTSGGTLTINTSLSFPGNIVVEDIGPV